MALQFRPDHEKIVELLLYLAHALPGADKYQAVKMFYLADREHLLRYGRPITQESYVAMDYGPVASTVLDLFNHNRNVLARFGGAEGLPFTFARKQRSNGRELAILGEPRRQIDRSLFSKSDLRVFDEVIAKYGSYSFNQLFRLTHKHFAYTRAWNERNGRNASQMRYEEMIESPDDRERLLEELGPVSAHF